MGALDRVQDALEAHGCANKGNDWVCPSHADGDPSLSVNEGDSGVAMHCHAGCTTEQVLSAIGLKMSDLFDTPVANGKLNIVATYPYVGEDGGLLYEVVRLDPKDFRQRVPLGGGKWKWSIKDVRRVPYRLPQVRAAIERGETIYIVEGEKDVESIENVGGVATCNSGGAGKWRDEYAQFFKGAHVVIVADNDAPGVKHAQEISASLVAVTQSLSIVRPLHGKDATDHIRAGGTLHDFKSELLITDDIQPPTRVNPMDAIALDANDIDNIPPPNYIIDKFITNDSINVIYGQPGACKSFLAIDWALSIANGLDWHGHKVIQGDVLFVGAEGLTTIGLRKLAWQTERGLESSANIKWYPEPINLLDVGSVEDLLDYCSRLQFLSIFFDTLSRSMPGQDENAPGPMTTVIENLDAIRRETRAGVNLVHHTPKDGSSPRGHSSLMGAVWTGIKVSKSDDGDVKVDVEKQKHDEGVSKLLRLKKVAGSAVLYPASEFDRPKESLAELEVLSAIRMTGLEGMSSAKIIQVCSLPERTFHNARATLVSKGQIVNLGTPGKPRWVATDTKP